MSTYVLGFNCGRNGVDLYAPPQRWKPAGVEEFVRGWMDGLRLFWAGSDVGFYQAGRHA